MTPLAGPAFVVVGVLGAAGVAKVWRPSPTATALREIRVPKPLLAARLMGLGEVVVGMVALATGHPLAWGLVAAAYTGFALFVLWALRSDGAVGSCGCFGHEDTPPTPGHAAFNAAAAAIAALVVSDPVGVRDLDGSATERVLAVTLVAAAVYASILALTSLPRLLAIASGNAPVAVPSFALRPESDRT
ncbi:MAG: MauE/DoxX family redox-associated membrane protein [Acidimicrobiales bacterium]